MRLPQCALFGSGASNETTSRMIGSYAARSVRRGVVSRNFDALCEAHINYAYARGREGRIERRETWSP